MAAHDKLAILKNELESNISSFGKKRNENKWKALWLKLAVTLLAGATTVVLGLQGIASDLVLRNIGLVLTAIVTVLTTWDTFFNHRAMWVRYTWTYTTLRAIQSDLLYTQAGSGENISEGKIDELYGRLQSALKETNDWWQDDRVESGLSRNHG